MVDAQSVDQPLGDQSQDRVVSRAEHLGVLDAHADEVVDREEAPVPAGERVDIEEARALTQVAPVRIRVVRAM